MSKDFLRRLVVIFAIMVSGLAMSLVFVGRTTLLDILMLLAAPIASVALLPRKDWPRIAVFVFLFASVYGIGRIAAEMGRTMLYGDPLPQAPERYVYELLLYILYGLIWVGWWWRNREGGIRKLPG
ncbi:MAG: hypothetical protein ACREVR_13460 [Burkholderiales bacterium]